VRGDTPPGGEMNKSDSGDQKRGQFFQEKIGVTPSIAARG